MMSFNLYTVCFPIVLLIAFAFGYSLPANSGSPERTDHLSELIGTQDQQIGKGVFEIFEDQQGNLWFGTQEKGVARFDGKVLTYFNAKDGLCGNTVANITEDEAGQLWIGTHSNMCRFQASAEEENFLHFPKDDAGVPLLGWGWKKVMTDRNGKLWVNTHHGIFQYEDDKFTEFKVPVKMGDVAGYCSTPGLISLDLVDSKGNLWFGTDGDGVYQYDGTSFTHFTKKDGLPSNTITGIVEDKQGDLWFSCIQSITTRKGDGGLGRYDGTSFTTFSEEGLSSNNINTIRTDRSGNLWVGATGVGVYHHNGTAFTLIPEPAGVDLTATAYISGLQSMLEDSKGRFWFGFSGGLYRLEGHKMVNITQAGPWK